MKKRAITFCALCGKARLSLKHGLCRKCAQLCSDFADDTPLDDAAINRLLDDLEKLE